MAFISTTAFFAIFGIIALYALSRVRRSKGNGLPLPPGPKGVPILGNVNDMPKPGVLEWHHWLAHKDLYGMSEPGQISLRFQGNG
jgi:hypothetical protein